MSEVVSEIKMIHNLQKDRILLRYHLHYNKTNTTALSILQSQRNSNVPSMFLLLLSAICPLYVRYMSAICPLYVRYLSAFKPNPYRTHTEPIPDK